MATEEKSIEISYKANIQDLKSKLSQIPNITDQEAKKMVAALDRQLKQAESASKKAAEASKKAAQSASKAAMNAQHDFDDLAHSAKRAEEKLDLVAEKSGDIDRGFSSVGLALRGVNPQIAEAADGMADMFAVGEGLILTFKSLNPVVLGVTIALGALTLGYTAYKASIEEANKAILDQKEAMKGLQQQYLNQRNNFMGSVDALNDLRDQLSLANGEMSQYEYDRSKAARDTQSQFNGFITAQEEIIESRKEERALIQQIKAGNINISDNDKERIRNLQLLTSGVSKTKDLLDGSAESSGYLGLIEAAITEDIRKQNLGLDMLTKQKEEAVVISKQLVDISEGERMEAEANAKAQKKITKEKVEQVNIQEDLLKAIEEQLTRDKEQMDQRQSHLDELQKIIDENIMSEDYLKEQAFEKELQRISEIGRMTGDYHQSDIAIFALTQKRKMELLEEEQKKREDMAKVQKEQTADLLSGVEAFSSATLQAAIDNGVANSKVIGGLFAMQQASAIAQIAFSTSEAIAKSMTYPPPLNGIMAGLAVATGAAQTASVMAQKPPTPSMHMGGVAPDEMSATVLKGEAILDRGTVRKLGGEQGIKNLQQSSPKQDNIVVVQPFRHFGRFVREIGFKAPKQTGIRVY